MSNVISLAAQRLQPRSRAVSQETVDCLRSLLTRAEAGEIVGLVYAGMEADRQFIYSACGEAHASPGFASQMASALWYGTMRRVFGEEE